MYLHVCFCILRNIILIRPLTERIEEIKCSPLVKVCGEVLTSVLCLDMYVSTTYQPVMTSH